MAEEFKRYLYEYRHEGADWGIEIVASSRADAQARLKALAFARYQGEVKLKLPIPGGNLFRRILSAMKSSGTGGGE